MYKKSYHEGGKYFLQHCRCKYVFLFVLAIVALALHTHLLKGHYTTISKMLFALY